MNKIDYNLLYMAAVDIYDKPEAIERIGISKQDVANMIQSFADRKEGNVTFAPSPGFLLRAHLILEVSQYLRHPSTQSTLKALEQAIETSPRFILTSPKASINNLLETRLLLEYRRMKAGANGEMFMIEAQRYLSEKLSRRVGEVETLGHVFGVSTFVDGMPSLHKELASIVKEFPERFQLTITQASERGDFRKWIVKGLNGREFEQMKEIGKRGSLK